VSNGESSPIVPSVGEEFTLKRYIYNFHCTHPKELLFVASGRKQIPSWISVSTMHFVKIDS